MGELFAQHFISSHQQVGDFRAVRVGSEVQKNGGNVASHFVTPDGRLIHSVTGPVSAETLLEEAEWALDMYAEALTKAPGQAQRQFVAWRHQQAANASRGRDLQVHQLLMKNPLPPLRLVFEEIFEKILGQRVSSAGPRLSQAAVGLQIARDTGRPILFVLHDDHRGGIWGGGDNLSTHYGVLTRQLMGEYVVIAMPIREAPALSQLTKRPPYESSGAARPLFIVTRSDGEQLDSLSGWNDAYLARSLAAGWVDALERDPPKLQDLARVTRQLDKHYPELADRTRDLTIRIKRELQAARDARLAAGPEE